MNIHRGYILAVAAAAQCMVVLDSSIVNVALPAIRTSLGFSEATVSWIVTAYVLLFGGFLLLGGRAADLFGRKRVFMGGLLGFVVASFLGGIAESPLLLVLARGAQGVAAACMSPAALSIIITVFTEERERHRAFAVWGMVSAGGATIGLLLGGALTEYVSWRWDFFVNVPFGLLLAVMAYRYLPAHLREEKRAAFDVLGALYVTLGMVLLVYGISVIPAGGSMPVVSGLLGVVLLGVFVVHEGRVAHPLMPLRIWRIRTLAVANAVQLPVVASMFSLFFFMTLYFQEVLLLSPVYAGLAFLPLSLSIAVSSFLAPRVAVRLGRRVTITMAPLVLALCLLWLAMLPVQASYALYILPCFVVLGLGMGMSFVAVTMTATSGVPKHEAGLASGLLNTSAQLGGALGLSLLSMVAGLVTAAQAPEMTAQLRLVAGYHSAFVVAAGIALVGAAIAWFGMKGQQ